MTNWKIIAVILMVGILACIIDEPIFGEAVAGEHARNITVKADDLVFHYQKESFWNEDQFSKIIKDKDKFKRDQIERFDECMTKGIYVTSYKVEFDESRRSTTLRCDVHKAISKSGDRYTAEFEWLLDPLGLDFIDDNFIESKKGLSWEGYINGILTDIMVELPHQDVVYKAWQHLIGHCHKHAWWIEVSR